MVFRTLGFRLAFLVAVALVAALAGLLSSLTSRFEEDLRLVKQEEGKLLADTIKRSLKHAMMAGPKGFADIPEIIRPVSAREEIERIRIYNKSGEIRYSSDLTEPGTRVDLRADACIQCHSGRTDRALERLAGTERTRIYDAPESERPGRLLGVIDAIYNEPQCWNAACHEHSETQKVLGVLDVVVSLREMDDKIARDSRQLWLLGALGTCAILALVVILIQFLVQRPVAALVRGTEIVGQLNLEHRIPADRKDELGDLSRAFNDMTSRLKTAQDELRSFSDGLEEKVRVKTGELQAAQKQMIRAEKLAAVGHMAAGVAHEINNPLTGVVTLAHLLKKKFAADSREGQDLEMIIEEARRCSRIVRGLLDFARGSELDRRLADLNRILDRALALVENQALFHNIEIVRDYQSDLPRIPLDGDRIEQVFLNLILNAAEAMSDGGRLVLATAEARGEEGFARSIRVTVSDDGAGIPEEIQGRIFDPFFTTKETGKGTGLGLAVSYGIIEDHGGRIRVRSSVGEGTTFTIHLPVEEDDRA